jgi:Rrf2 family transcriptional regulator, iron-sulfur cluster assembly transcription factor
MFSKSCEYAIRAMIYIAGQSIKGIRVGLRDIAHEIDSPLAFTAKILQQLSRNGILQSVKGPTGGFTIDLSRMQQISLGEIVKAIDGERIFKTCGLGLKNCSEKQPCPVHEKFKTIRGDLCRMLDSTSVYELTLGLKDGSTFLKGV